jgi:hypothetical protein
MLAQIVLFDGFGPLDADGLPAGGGQAEPASAEAKAVA